MTTRRKTQSCCGMHITDRLDGHCDWTCCEHRDDDGRVTSDDDHGDERGWPEGQQPTPEQWVAWFTANPPDRQAEVAEHVIRSQERSTRCFLMNHDGAVEEMQHLQRAASEAYARGWREALDAFMENWGTTADAQALAAARAEIRKNTTAEETPA